MAAPPRLAVVGDVPPERVGGGTLLLYRLLAGHPSDRLTVIHGPHLAVGDPAVRLPGVEYRAIRYPFPRWVRNRCNPGWPILMAALARRHSRAVRELLADFAPEAILTVSHEYLWFAAAAAARRLDLPLHLIVHDDWSSLQTANRPGAVGRLVRWGCRRGMGRVYRQARSRLCVSPGMEEQCRQWFGAAGTVLYPSRGDDSPAPAVRVRPGAGGPPVVAFCGGIHQGGTAELLRQLAVALEAQGGRLDLYTVWPKERLAALGLDLPAVRVAGFFPANELAERIGDTAHALFLPASFDPREQTEVATLFPSKLADYTAIGLPVLVWGPASSSAARWVADNPEAAVVVTDPSGAAIPETLAWLATDGRRATRVAAAGVAAGERYFELSAARRVFYEAIQGGR